jgi:hypothetical protein
MKFFSKSILPWILPFLLFLGFYFLSHWARTNRYPSPTDYLYGFVSPLVVLDSQVQQLGDCSYHWFGLSLALLEPHSSPLTRLLSVFMGWKYSAFGNQSLSFYSKRFDRFGWLSQCTVALRKNGEPKQ